MDKLVERMIRAARLDASLYEEVEANRETLAQATTVVVLASLAAGIGGFGTGGALGIVLLTLGSLVGWYVWAYLTYLIGTRLLAEAQTTADLGELLRTLGFSSSPGVLRILGVIPGLASVVYAVVSIWMLVAMIVAVRQALDFTSTWRAVAVCLIGWIVQGIVLGLLLLALGDSAAPG